MEQEPKISLPEIIIITPYLVIFDLIGVGLFFFGLDDLFILDAVRFPVTQLYLRFKGVKGTATLVGNILELVPYVGALPISTATWLITIYLDRNPEKMEMVSNLASAKLKKKRNPRAEQELSLDQSIESSS